MSGDVGSLSLLLPPCVDLALLANPKRNPAIRTVPLGSPSWDVREANTLEMEPFLFTLLKTQVSFDIL